MKIKIFYEYMDLKIMSETNAHASIGQSLAKKPRVQVRTPIFKNKMSKTSNISKWLMINQLSVYAQQRNKLKIFVMKAFFPLKPSTLAQCLELDQVTCKREQGS